MKQECSAGGVVYRKNQQNIEILFILDPYGKWAFPKGHIEAGEESKQAALREIEEETNIAIDNLKIIHCLGDMKYSFTWEGKKVYKTVDFYLVEAEFDVEVKPQRAEGISQIKWVEMDKSLDFLDYKNTGEILQKAIKYLKNTE